MPDLRAVRPRLQSALGSAAVRLASPARNAVDRRLTAVAGRIEGIAAATHEEGAATRATTAALGGSIDEHMQAVIEATSHLGARVERALQTLERIEARLERLESTPVNAGRRDEE